MLDVSRYEDQSVVGISEAGNEIIIPSELLNQVGYLNGKNCNSATVSKTIVVSRNPLWVSVVHV